MFYLLLSFFSSIPWSFKSHLLKVTSFQFDMLFFFMKHFFFLFCATKQIKIQLKQNQRKKE